LIGSVSRTTDCQGRRRGGGGGHELKEVTSSGIRHWWIRGVIDEEIGDRSSVIRRIDLPDQVKKHKGIPLM